MMIAFRKSKAWVVRSPHACLFNAFSTYEIGHFFGQIGAQLVKRRVSGVFCGIWMRMQRFNVMCRSWRRCLHQRSRVRTRRVRLTFVGRRAQEAQALSLRVCERELITHRAQVVRIAVEL